MALDSASIILSAIYLIVYREFEGYGLWCFVWFVLACVIYFILLKYYDCQKSCAYLLADCGILLHSRSFSGLTYKMRKIDYNLKNRLPV